MVALIIYLHIFNVKYLQKVLHHLKGLKTLCIIWWNARSSLKALNITMFHFKKNPSCMSLHAISVSVKV